LKKSAGAQNDDVIQGLQQTMKEFEEEIKFFKETMKNEKQSRSLQNVLKPEDIFPLVGTLYHLNINGQQIRDQVNGLKLSLENTGREREIHVKLPSKANSSTIMRQFKTSFNPK
jgi:hypothetical protein